MSKEKYLKPKAEEIPGIQSRRENFLNLPEDLKERETRRFEHEAHLLNAETFWKKIKTEKDPEQKKRLALALDVVETVKAEGGLALVVGGYARDEVLRRLGYDLNPKDIDLEVYGLEYAHLQELLTKRFHSEVDVRLAGAQFLVIKLGGNLLDVSIPRTDSKTGRGHGGFSVKGDPNMSVKEAARRRDFTMNAMALDPLTGQVIDEWGGLDDIAGKRLRATDLQLFGDDPLRVFRAMQFAGRFGFTIEPKTMEICRSIDISEIDAERISEEWQKLIEKSPKPSLGLEAARELGIIEKLYPELQSLIGCEQDSEWHPEGDVWKHTLMAADAAAEIARRENLNTFARKVVVLGALCHDLGKPATTKFEEGRIRSRGHEKAGVEPTKRFLSSILKAVVNGKEIIKKVASIVQDHLFPAQHENPTKKALNRLAARLNPATTQELYWVSESDHRGRDLKWDGFPRGEEFLRRAKELKIEKSRPDPWLQGRDLIQLGFKPGPKFGQVLGAVYEAQLDDLVRDKDEALVMAKKILSSN